MSTYNNASPFSNELGGLIDNFFNSTIGDFIGRDIAYNLPAVNVTETATAFRIDLAAPGLEKSDFNIQLDKNQIIISAKKENNSETENFKRREFNYSNFERRFTLPPSADKTAIKAQYENGILAVTIDKVVISEENTSTTIAIS